MSWGTIILRRRFPVRTVTILSVWMVLAVTVFPAGAMAEDGPADTPAPGDTAAPAADDAAREPEAYSLHIQGTYTSQGHPKFHSAIPDGPQSMLAQRQVTETGDVTLFAGIRLGDLELYVNPEMDQGFGPSGTYGIAGYTTGEAYKVGLYNPYFHLPRMFGRYVIGLGGGQQAIDPGPNQLGGTRDAENVTFTFGKLSVVDIFDTNTYAHDPRADFLNWGMLDMGAFDYAAESWGFTYGAAVEWTQSWWTLRAGLFSMPRAPNDKYLDPDFRQSQSVAEAEERHEILSQPGKVKALFFVTSANMASYTDALSNPANVGQVRYHQFRPGGGINLEQQIVPDLGGFLRASMNDGTKEEYAFTDINQSLAGGLSLKGECWGRANDTIGLGASINTISRQARQFFAAGGMGGLVGDGQLPAYQPEQIIEAYYKASVMDGIALTLDYQRVTNPGYDAVRGPIDFYSFRIHTEY